IANNLAELLDYLLPLVGYGIQSASYPSRQLFGRPSEVRFEYLTDVHSRRHTQRIQNYLDRRTVRKIGHVLFGEYPGDDALVPVTASHLIADGQLALHCDKDLDHLDDARRQLVALLELFDVLLMKLALHADLPLGPALEFAYLGSHVEPAAGDLDLAQRADLQRLQQLPGQLGALGLQLLVLVNEIFGKLLALEQLVYPLIALLFQDSDLVTKVLFEFLFLGP